MLGEHYNELTHHLQMNARNIVQGFDSCDLCAQPKLGAVS
jgi:hypothetical protein